jgi:hemerythrin-like domain-containing protein
MSESPGGTDRIARTATARYGAGDADLTVMRAAHQAFRRDLGKLAAAAARARSWAPERQDAVRAGWAIFQRQLLVHHRGEDRAIWPLLQERLAGQAAAVSVLEAMEAEHERIDPLLTAVSQALGFGPAGPGPGDGPSAPDAVDELATQLSHHLAHEERDALPLIGQALSAAEWRSMGRTIGAQSGAGPSFVPEFFGWLLDGAAADQRAAVLATLPAVMRPLVTGVFRPVYARRAHW